MGRNNGGFGGGRGGMEMGKGGLNKGVVSSTATTSTLTTESDAVGTSANDVIVATASTFNAGDSINGGAGMDILKLTDAGTFNLNSLAAFSGIETVQGATSANQIVTLKDGVNLSFVAGNGNNTITTGATGTQSVSLGKGTNTVTAVGGSTTVTTNGGTDTIVGGTGLLTVKALTGTSTITAGSGGSHIDLGSGTVALTAGAGVDTIDVGAGLGTISVTGFTQGTDIIDLHALHLSSYDDLLLNATVTSTSTETIIAFDYGATITLTGVASVSATDFSFTDVCF
jgi:hypothetical protein